MGIGLTGRKGGRFAVITESIAVASAEMIDKAVYAYYVPIMCHLMYCKTSFCSVGTRIRSTLKGLLLDGRSHLLSLL